MKPQIIKLTEEPGRLQSLGSWVTHNLRTKPPPTAHYVVLVILFKKQINTYIQNVYLYTFMNTFINSKLDMLNDIKLYKGNSV